MGVGPGGGDPALFGSLPPMDHARRLDGLVDLAEARGCDALVITHATNVRYLSGFSGSAGVLVVGRHAVVLVTDGRYATQAPSQVEAAVPGRIEVRIGSDEQGRLVREALGGATRIGLEAEHVSWAARDRYARDWFEGLELVATSGLVESLRETKDDGEVARIAAACQIADRAFAATRHVLGDEPTEAEFAMALDHEIRRLGAAGNSFPTIVASGPNGARPHARPGSRRIVEGDLVVIDFGAVVDGYCSDMTRTIAVGEPGALASRMLEVVREAQACGVATVAAGVTAAEVDAACRRIIADAGWADAFVHGTGHGVGLDIHEAPRVAASSTATLATGHVITVEPGVYLPPHGGVRIEDTVVVAREGAIPLTHSTKSTTIS